MVATVATVHGLHGTWFAWHMTDRYEWLQTQCRPSSAYYEEKLKDVAVKHINTCAAVVQICGTRDHLLHLELTSKLLELRDKHMWPSSRVEHLFILLLYMVVGGVSDSVSDSTCNRQRKAPMIIEGKVDDVISLSGGGSGSQRLQNLVNQR